MILEKAIKECSDALLAIVQVRQVACLDVDS